MSNHAPSTADRSAGRRLVRDLGLLDATMIVAGSMIGSGIFIVSADIARQTGSAGWLLVVWMVSGLLALLAALMVCDLLISPKTRANTWPGLLIVLAGAPVYHFWNKRRPRAARTD